MSPGSCSTLRVMVVDDNRDAADSLAFLLRLLGHAAFSAYDGPSALAGASVFKPDVAILDLRMPGMDGIELAHALWARPGMQDLVVLALSADDAPEDVRQTREAGFTAHLVKPVQGVLASILRALAQKSPSAG